MDNTFEVWLPVVGYEGLYSVSSYGQLRSESRSTYNVRLHRYHVIPARILKLSPTICGCLFVGLSKNRVKAKYPICRLVAAAFIGPSESQVWHLDKDNTNSRAENLVYRTPSNLIGQRFERLVVIRPAPKLYHWICQCDCGKLTRPIATSSLVDGYTSSCGCLRSKKSSIAMTAMSTVHGMAGTPVYAVWNSMVQRCVNSNHQSWDSYGGRGIKVCQHWRSFVNWYADMGDPPYGLSIDRRNNLTGGYWCGHCEECIANGWPANCYWATKEEQDRNRRTNRNLTLGDKTQCLTAWAEEIGISPSGLSARLDRDWTIERALTTPCRR